jgi:hypothetical protein
MGKSGGTQLVRVQRAQDGNGWILRHPPCVRECSEDLDEVRNMIAAGEIDTAIDELRWLLGVCSEMIEAHFLLGKLAVEADGDVPLARGHFGVGYQLVITALKRAGNPHPLPALHPANRPFYDAGRGLAWSLTELGKADMALEVVQRMIEADPTDPFALRGWIDEIRTDGKLLVPLEGLG